MATLLLAAIVSSFLGQRLDAAIIIAIIVVSVVLDFYQVHQAKRAVADLRSSVALTATVRRDGHDGEVAVAELVPGDVIRLTAGTLVPADARLFEGNDLYARESALTGESLPVRKSAATCRGAAALRTRATLCSWARRFRAAWERPSSCLPASTPSSESLPPGSPSAIRSRFDRGIKTFGFLLIRVILLLVFFVFFVNVIAQRPLLECFFSRSPWPWASRRSCCR